MDVASKQLLVINMHKGLYQYHRLSYGVFSALAIFQSVMDQILQGVEGVVCFLDDILITTEKHLCILDKVLTQLKHYGLQFKLAECKTVHYLRHVVDAEGIYPTNEKVVAIIAAPRPRNEGELRSFLGLLDYYGRFLANLSTTLQPLHKLLQKGKSKDCEEAFQKCKHQLLDSHVLAHYDTHKPLHLACDAYYGVGAVISHVMANGEECPITFASWTLISSERGYVQIEKETLAIIFGVKKFHKYLYGCKFTLITDHKPLMEILGPKVVVPTLAALRMQRWALMLLAYNYEIKYCKSADHTNADTLSRLPRQVIEPDRVSQISATSSMRKNY
uniref:ribonuclease H n=1 Tax=Latimeria chalumnae TaxID=7897 RepID=H2ZXJ5_LATCH